MKVFILTLNFLTLLYIILSYYNIKGNNFSILIFLFSCNRELYLNKTINSIFYHLYKYDYNISFTFIYSDSGTKNRDYIIKKYNLVNVFYMNPSSYNYVYRIAFSYLYKKYVLFLEDDRPFVEDIEERIIYRNFIEEGLAILDITSSVYGITFKPDISSEIKIIRIKSYLGYHILCIAIKPNNDYYFVNGPTLYKTKYLKLLKDYINEHSTALSIKNHSIYYGYTYKNLTCLNNFFSIKCQSVSVHLDRNKTYSTNNRLYNQCNIFLY